MRLWTTLFVQPCNHRKNIRYTASYRESHLFDGRFNVLNVLNATFETYITSDNGS